MAPSTTTASSLLVALSPSMGPSLAPLRQYTTDLAASGRGIPARANVDRPKPALRERTLAGSAGQAVGPDAHAAKRRPSANCEQAMTDKLAASLLLSQAMTDKLAASLLLSPGPNMSDNERYQAAIARFDAANAEDPRRIVHDGKEY